MYLRFARVIAKGYDYEHVETCRSVWLGGKIGRNVVTSLAHCDEVEAAEVDALIQNLQEVHLLGYGLSVHQLPSWLDDVRETKRS